MKSHERPEWYLSKLVLAAQGLEWSYYELSELYIYISKLQR